MNVQNVAALANQLQELGFADTGGLLLKRICFKPDNFSLVQKIIKGKELMLFSLYFEKLQDSDTYVLLHYDITLQKENSVSTSPLDGIFPAELEKLMTGIDWRKAFSLDENKQWTANDKSTWETELKISGIIESLSVLENSEQGKVIAACLKQKFWQGTLYQEIVGAITPVKNKADVSQRFYISEDGSGITADEAYRFLQNKYLEKQLQLKRKQADNTDKSADEDATGSSNSGLLKKKRIAGKSKRNRVSQD